MQPTDEHDQGDVLERKEKALSEPAWEAVKSIHQETLLIWRTENALVKIVKQTDYGIFLNDAIYIILKACNKQRKICYDLHFWLPNSLAKSYGSSVPEKVLELSALLNDNVVLHKENENFESKQLTGYFKTFFVLFGGNESLFDEANPTAYKPRLLAFQLCGDHATLRQIPSSLKSLNSRQVFVLDNGLTMLQWNGKFCSDKDRLSASTHIEHLLGKRSGKLMREFYDEEDLLEVNPFSRLLGLHDVEPSPAVERSFKKSMHRLSDESGDLKLIPVFKGRISRDAIEPSDVNFIDTPNGLFIYIGPSASRKERESIWEESERYLSTTEHPLNSIHVIKAGEKSYEFEEIWNDYA